MNTDYSGEIATDLLKPMQYLLNMKYRLQDINVKEPEIEEAIRRIYEERLLEK